MNRATALFWVLLVTVGIFSPLLVADFIWDDEILVTENLWTHDVSNLPRFFSAGLWESTPIAEPESPYYRPMMLVELLLDRQIFGLSPLAHHVHNLLWHLLCVSLLWKLLISLTDRTLAALSATAIYALHPFQTEVVAFTAARNDSMAVAGMLGALLLLRGSPSPRRLLAAGACALYALLSKETALLLPVLLLALDWLEVGGPRGKARYGVLGGALVIFLILRTRVTFVAPSGGGVQLLETGALMFASYLERGVWPLQISSTTPLEVLEIRALPLTAGALLVPLSLWAGGRMAAVGLLFSALALLPATVGVLHYGGLPYRYATPALLGVAMVWLASWQRHPNHPGSLVVPLLLAAATAMQLPTWASTTALWEHGHQISPGTHTACGLFKAYESDLNRVPRDSTEWSSRYAQAEATLLLALKPPPSDYCCFSASRWYWKMGETEKTVTQGRLALELGCAESPELLAPLSMAEAITGRWDVAEARASRVRSDPTGLVPVVLSAAALRRGDESVLRAWEAKGAGGATVALRDQVELVLSRSDATQPSSSESPTPEPPPQ